MDLNEAKQILENNGYIVENKHFDFFGNSTIESIIQYLDERIESDRRCNNYVFNIDSELGF